MELSYMCMFLVKLACILISFLFYNGADCGQSVSSQGKIFNRINTVFVNNIIASSSNRDRAFCSQMCLQISNCIAFTHDEATGDCSAHSQLDYQGIPASQHRQTFILPVDPGEWVKHWFPYTYLCFKPFSHF